jgi:hypothetical protein
VGLATCSLIGLCTFIHTMRAAWEYKRLMSTRMALAIFLLAAALGAALPVESRVVEESASLPAASLMDDGRNMASELGFGKAMLKHFSIDKEYINLNHGVVASGTFSRVPSRILLEKSIRG